MCKIVFTNGCFDLLHPGHIKLLSEAKKLGDQLYVGINSDSSIRRIKGPGRPFYNQYERFEMVSAIKYVDFAHLFYELTPIKLIEDLMPDVIVKGGDYKAENVVGYGLAEVVIIPLFKEYSTTKLIERVYGKL